MTKSVFSGALDLDGCNPAHESLISYHLCFSQCITMHWLVP